VGRNLPPGTLLASALVPIYEYRCPNGHVFEVFKAMSAPAPEACEVCGASPVEIVLSPVAIHYKGSGFYSTDYGKKKRAKEAAASSDSGGGGEKKPDGSKSESSSTEPKKKDAAA
jgi:putative FmdB family regulatory protein